MTTVANLRAETGARSDVCYVLFIEGLDVVYTTDESGAIEGTGSASWIGLSEQDIIDAGGSDEVVGQRTVKRGLKIPASVGTSVNLKSGSLQSSPIRFQIVDMDDSLRTLFATEGKTYDLLHPGTNGSDFVPAGTTALGTSITINSATQTTNPRGKHIDLERIGPQGQRNFFPCFPNFALPGPEHFTNATIAKDPGVAPRISTDPLVFSGRRVALYRLYRDHHADFTAGASEASKWPVWLDQHNAGGLVWYGTMRDAGEYNGNDEWTISCLGMDSLLEKDIGIRTNMDWVRVGAPLNLSTTAGEKETGVAVWFSAKYVNGDAAPIGDFDGDIFGTDLTGGGMTKANIVSELDSIFNTAVSGAGNYTSGALGPFDVPTGGGANVVNSAGDLTISPSGWLKIKKDITYSIYRAHIVLHEKVWRRLGYDIGAQHFSSNVYEDVYQIKFYEYQDGEEVYAGSLAPGPGYWMAEITTAALGHDDGNPHHQNPASNNGDWKYYRPLFVNDVQVLTRKGEQEITVIGSPQEHYCQGNLVVPQTDTQHGDGASTPNRAGVFAFRGSYRRMGSEEVEETTQVAICAWKNTAWATTAGKDDGQINSQDADGNLSLILMRWLDPRVFGFDSPPLETDWSFTAAEDGNPISLRPLSCMPYFLYDTPEYADATLAQVLLSTGTCTGYDGPAVNLPTFTRGSNNPGDATGSLFFHGDLLNYSMGLRIPEELVSEAEDIRAAFPFSPDAPINRTRFAWFGMRPAAEVIYSITEPRRMMWRMHGGKLALTEFAEFSHEDTDAAITESDLSGQPENPQSVIPKQDLRATGSIDSIKLTYGAGPDGNTYERVDRAQDHQARHRTSRIEHKVTAEGLVAADRFTAREIEAEKVTGLAAWWPQWRQLWAVEAAEFFSRRHFMIRGLRVDRVAGQDLQAGSKVRVTNPWILDASGNKGVTNAAGIVTSAKHQLGGRAVILDVLMFARGSPSQIPYYAPIAKAKGYDSATRKIHFYDDWRGIGSVFGEPYATGDDLTGFAEPDWSTGGGSTVIQAWYWDGDVTNGIAKLNAGPTATVSAVDKASNTITITAGGWSSWSGPAGSTTTLYRDMDWYFTLTTRDGGSTPQWVQDLYGFYVLPDTYQTTGGTPGRSYT